MTLCQNISDWHISLGGQKNQLRYTSENEVCLSGFQETWLYTETRKRTDILKQHINDINTRWCRNTGLAESLGWFDYFSSSGPYMIYNILPSVELLLKLSHCIIYTALLQSKFSRLYDNFMIPGRNQKAAAGLQESFSQEM